MFGFRDALSAYTDRVRPVTVYNLETAETAVPFAAMQIRGFASNGSIQVSKPLSDNLDSSILFNGPCPIGPLSEGQATSAMPTVAAFLSNGAAPAAGEFWGTKFDSWYLHRDRYGFIVLGGGTEFQTMAVTYGHSQFMKPIRVESPSTMSDGYTNAKETVWDVVTSTMGDFASVYAHNPNTPGVAMDSGYYLGILAGQWKYKKVYLCLAKLTSSQAASLSSSSGSNKVTAVSDVFCQDGELVVKKICIAGPISSSPGACS